MQYIVAKELAQGVFGEEYEIIKEYNAITDGFPYSMVRDRIKEYWKNNNGKVLTTKKTKTKDNIYCTYTVRIEY